MVTWFLGVKYLRCEIYEQISKVLLSQYNKKTLSMVGKHLTWVLLLFNFYEPKWIHWLRVLWFKSRPGLLWWLSGHESTCQCRRHGFNLCSGNILQAVEQLSWCTKTIEPVLWSPGATTTEGATHMPQLLKSTHPRAQCSATRETITLRSLHTIARE